VAADDLEDGKAAYQNFEYELAMRILRPLAESGDATAQLYVGLMYSGLYARDQSIPENRIEAYAWFNLATAGQVPMGPYYQGRMRDGMNAAQLKEVGELSLLYWTLYVEPFL
jgi:TPR repeat protein